MRDPTHFQITTHILRLSLLLSLCGGATRARARPALPEALRSDAAVSAWAEGLPHAPPSPRFSLRRWELNRRDQEGARRRGSARGAGGGEEGAPLPDWIASLGGYLPRAWLAERGMAGGASPPLSREEMARQGFQLDEHTDAKAPPFSYERSFVPSEQPHGRGRVFNGVSEDGALRVHQGAQLTPMFERFELGHCFEPVVVAQPGPSVTHNLMLGEGRWLPARALNLECARAVCAASDRECFLGAFRVRGWDGELMSVTSVSPDQALVYSPNLPSSLRLLRDEAHMYYLTSEPPAGAREERALRAGALTPTWRELEVVHLIISSPRTYFSASWDFKGQPISARSADKDAQLPQRLRGEALALLSDLGLDPQGSFQDQIYALASWFRAFELGALPEGDDSDLYQRVTRSQRGVCRHRAYAFMITARAMGVPTRLVTNAVHAFVEVLDPMGAWRRVDLGGEAPIERFTSTSDELSERAGAEGPVFPDHLPAPQGALERERAQLQEQLRGFYEQPRAVQAELLQVGADGPPLSTTAEALPPLGDDPAFDLKLEALLEGAKRSARAPVAPVCRGEGCAGRGRWGGGEGGGEDPVERAERAENAEHAEHAERAERAEGPQGRCKEPLAYPPPPPLKTLPDLPAAAQITAHLTTDTEPRVTRCELISLTGKISGVRGVRGAQVRLFWLLKGEPQDLGAWALVEASGRFKMRAQVPWDAPTGEQALWVRLEAQGRSRSLEAPVEPSPPPPTGARGRRRAR